MGMGSAEELHCKISGFLFVVRDVVCAEVLGSKEISEKELAEKNKLAQQISMIAMTAPGALCSFRLHPDGTASFPYVSPAWQELLGLTQEDVQGDASPAFKLIHPDDVPHIQKTIQDSAQGMTDWRTEFRVLSPTKGEIWVEGHSTPVRESDGSIIWHGFITDITDRKRAEEQLRLSEERFRAMVEGAPEAIFIQTEKKFSYLNEKALVLFGARSASELIGTPVLDRFHPDFHAAVQERIRMLNEGLTPAELAEEKCIRLDGSEVWVEATAQPIVYKGKRGALVFVRDITERKRAEETIKYQTYHDLLTGLPNRAFFIDILNREIPHMERTGMKIGVLFLNIDRFKSINELLGYEAGDALLKDIATRLRTSTREADATARIGGDKFSVMLPLVARPEDASRTADKIMKALKASFVIGSHEFHITTSIGISLFPEDGNSAEALLKNAEIAMYHAKEQGRNNYQFFNEAQNIRTLERVMLENRLRQAINHGEMRVYYQPQVNIRTQKIVGVEALARWQHPDLGLLGAQHFIPIAEEIGLILDIDQWVIQTACAQLKKWHDRGCPIPFVGVNLSARQFQQFDLDQTISKILRKTEVSPEVLKAEITETIAMQDTELTFRNLSRLNALGIKLTIDDFGTGYSSLSYLKKLPIQKLKIDKSFIKDLAQDPSDQAVVQAVIAIAHSMKLGVIAEGVETEEQIAFLRSCDCDEIQGDLFSKPLPAEELSELIAQHVS